MANKPIKRIAVTGGAGQIDYSLLFRIASGECFGKDQPISLHILEIEEALKILKGVQMELEDCAFPLLKQIEIGSDPKKIFKECHFAILVGAKPRGPGMERADLLSENAKIFVEQGKALNEVADRNVQVLVVGNPCNTNCLIALKGAPDLNPKNFFAMTRLDQNRAAFQLAQKAKVETGEVKKIAIWGNHSATQVPDFFNATIQKKPVLEVIQDRSWLENQFISTIQKRGAEIIAARGKSSAASAANAIIDTIKDLQKPTEKDHFFSLALLSDGNPYQIDQDLIFSFPCRVDENGVIEIVKGLQLDPFLKNMLKKTENELIEERELASKIKDKV